MNDFEGGLTKIKKNKKNRIFSLIRRLISSIIDINFIDDARRKGETSDNPD